MSLENSVVADDSLDRADGMARVMPYALIVTGALVLAGAIAAGCAIYNHFLSKQDNKSKVENVQNYGGQR